MVCLFHNVSFSNSVLEMVILYKESFFENLHSILRNLFRVKPGYIFLLLDLKNPAKSSLTQYFQNIKILKLNPFTFLQNTFLQTSLFYFKRPIFWFQFYLISLFSHRRVGFLLFFCFFLQTSVYFVYHVFCFAFERLPPHFYVGRVVI